MNRIKTLIILPHLRTGGGQQLALDVAIGLQQDDRFDVMILCTYAKEDSIFANKAARANVNVQYLEKSNSGFDLRCFLRMTRFILSYKPDVVNTHLLAMPYTILAAFLYKNCSYFHTIHSVAEREGYGKMGFIEKLAYRFNRFHPIAISDFCGDTISKYYKLDKGSFPIIYNGIDTVRFACRRPYRERDCQTIRFISTGRFEKVKDHKLMINVFSEIHSIFPNTELILLGDGLLRSDIEELIYIKKLQEAVVLKGIVGNVENELNNAHIYLLTSEYEGLPLSILEAMCCGLPIVATKAGGVVDVVDNTNGILCDIGDQAQLIEACSSLVENEEKRYFMSDNNVKKANKYSIDRCVSEYAKLYINSYNKGHK